VKGERGGRNTGKRLKKLKNGKKRKEYSRTEKEEQKI
jgi:hypothetical protein